MPCRIKNKDSITFKPNNVTYTVDSQSPLGQKMSKSSVCVVVHTWHDAFGDKVGTPIKAPKKLNSLARVFKQSTQHVAVNWAL